MTEFLDSHPKPAMQTITQLDSQPGIFGVNTHPDPCDDVNEGDDDNDMEFKDSRLP